MTKQEYLSQIREAQQEIKVIIAELQHLYEQQMSIGGAMAGDRIHSTDISNRVEALAISVTDKQSRLIERAEALMVLQDEVSAVINAVDDIRLCVLLRLRYVSCLTWDRVAAVMHADVRTVYRWHELALDAVEIPEQ